MFAHIEAVLVTHIHTLPLELFVIVASVVEEVIAPIPSLTVMALSGTLAHMQGYTLTSLAMLAVLGSFGKTVGAFLVYVISDKAENVFIGMFGKFFSVSKDDIENLGKKLKGGTKDYVFLTLLRALPIVPSVVLSVGSGVLKIPLKLFIISTFLGSIIRDGLYIYTGYIGSTVFFNFIYGSTHIENYIVALVAVGVCAYVVYRFISKKSHTSESV